MTSRANDDTIVEQGGLLKKIVFVLLFVSLFLSSTFAAAGGTPSMAQAPIEVPTRDGWIRGRVQKGVNVFLGIPYAAPPINELRWKAPRDPEPWSGALDATHMKSQCAQLGNILSASPPEEFGKPVGSEDCLYLNVWAPAQHKKVKMPIVLWIHGGSNSKGTANEPNYEATRLSSETESVIVGVNYRLGFFGSFLQPSLKTGDALDDSGNFVTLDLLQALNWIRYNAEAFDGDAGNVTIMGQSAGCMNVWGLIQSPLAKGLFQKAICLSGIPNAYPSEMGEARSDLALAALLVRDHFISKSNEASEFLKTKDTAWIRNYLMTRTTADLLSIPSGIIPIQHLTDGVVIPKGGFADLAQGNFNRVPMIIGSTADEATFLLYEGLPGLNQRDFWRNINSKNRNLPLSALMSPVAFPGFYSTCKTASLDTEVSIDAIAATTGKFVPQLYRSKFVWKDLPQPWRDVFGSMHALDLLVLFGNFITDRPNVARFAWTPENVRSREQIHHEMMESFKGFIETGDASRYVKNDSIVKLSNSVERP